MNFITKILAWFIKNVALVVGVVEALAKVVAGIVTLTPTKADDKILPYVDKIASNAKKWLYTASDFLGKSKES